MTRTLIIKAEHTNGQKRSVRLKRPTGGPSLRASVRLKRPTGGPSLYTRGCLKRLLGGPCHVDN